MFHSTSARRTHNRAGNTIKLENITFARNNTKKNGISLKIPVSIANQAKIIIGDRIDILIDEVNGKLVREFTMEDVAFCRMIKEKGYDVWIDPNIIVGHEKLMVL